MSQGVVLSYEYTECINSKATCVSAGGGEAEQMYLFLIIFLYSLLFSIFLL